MTPTSTAIAACIDTHAYLPRATVTRYNTADPDKGEPLS